MKSKNLYIIAFAIFIIIVAYIGYGITIQCKESSVFVSCAKYPGGR